MIGRGAFIGDDASAPLRVLSRVDKASTMEEGTWRERRRGLGMRRAEVGAGVR